MLLNEVLPFLIRYWPAVIASVVVIHLLRNKFNKGLNKYPGPALAGYTNWWRFFDVWGRKTEWTHIHLHRKHGDFVRLGPNVISIADPKAIKTIYGLNKGMTKVSQTPTTIRPGYSRETSRTSTPSNKLPQMVSESGLCSPARTRIGMRSTGDALTEPSP